MEAKPVLGIVGKIRERQFVRPIEIFDQTNQVLQAPARWLWFG